ncbi:DUF2007 domain-containing protein [Hydrogenophaga sp. 5NK40-0174]|uniref:putative signal transducing protein n=1 Tax=Hydrogenophaga sp. 5NK40-0174 TaxID=3127649 RepID=UPI0031023DDF
MQIVYQAANSLEAHVVKDVLRQQGISSVVLGEHLQGAMGELPAANLVRVEVDDQEVDRARELISEWEAASPQDDGSSLQSRNASAGRSGSWLSLGLACGLGIAVGLVLPFPDTTHSSVAIHSNGLPEVQWTYDHRGEPVRYQQDRNRDGKVDVDVQYANGGADATELFDNDFDGVFETTSSIEAHRPVLTAVDTNGDKVVDMEMQFVHGVMHSMRYLDQQTGHPYRVEYFQLDKLIRTELDHEADGTIDEVVKYDGQLRPLARER